MKTNERIADTVDTAQLHQFDPAPNSQRKLDLRLDEALKDTFPASDPFSVVISTQPSRSQARS